MTRTTKKAAAKLNTAIAGAVKRFAPPESLTVDEWADKHRRLSPESSAEAGPWRTKRTPYLEEPMRAFTDPKVHKIVMVAASQVGKSELELNIIGYIIDQDPGSILYVHPTIDDARKFSRLRVAPMIRDSKPLKAKVHDVKAKDSGNTILQKSFPGGMLTLTGSNSASALASTPARYIIGDERDRWATSAGTEGDPWALAEARQATFYNAKAVEVSTPTIKGNSNIETSFYQGTEGAWCTAARVRGVQRDRVRQYPLRPGGQEDPREKVVEPQERRLVELPGLRLPDPRGRHAKATGQVDRRQPGRLQEGRPFFLAQLPSRARGLRGRRSSSSSSTPRMTRSASRSSTTPCSANCGKIAATSRTRTPCSPAVRTTAPARTAPLWSCLTACSC
jgi:hypothetical protein